MFNRLKNIAYTAYSTVSSTSELLNFMGPDNNLAPAPENEQKTTSEADSSSLTNDSANFQQRFSKLNFEIPAGLRDPLSDKIFNQPVFLDNQKNHILDLESLETFCENQINPFTNEPIKTIKESITKKHEVMLFLEHFQKLADEKEKYDKWCHVVPLEFEDYSNLSAEQIITLIEENRQQYNSEAFRLTLGLRNNLTSCITNLGRIINRYENRHHIGAEPEKDIAGRRLLNSLKILDYILTNKIKDWMNPKIARFRFWENPAPNAQFKKINEGIIEQSTPRRLNGTHYRGGN